MKRRIFLGILVGIILAGGGVVASNLVNLTTEVKGTLPHGNGGTDVTSSGAGGNVLRSNGSSWASAQLAFSDLSGSAGCGQMPALTSDVTTSAGSCTTTVANIGGTSASTVKTRSFGTTFGDTSAIGALTSGSIVYFTVPYACTIAAWDISVDAGTVTFDIWKIATGTAIPTVSNTITASAKPALSTGTSLHSTSMSGWTTAVTANDIFGIQLNTVATAKYAEIDITCNQ
jgi:hypothetical protein